MIFEFLSVDCVEGELGRFFACLGVGERESENLFHPPICNSELTVMILHGTDSLLPSTLLIS